MRLTTFLAALVALTIFLPATSHAQQALSGANPNASGRSVAATFGFTWAMSPGDAGEFGYPRVVRVVEGSSAARAGLLPGDTIVAVNGRDGRQVPLFPGIRDGAEYEIRVRRGGEERELLYRFARPAEPRQP